MMPFSRERVIEAITVDDKPHEDDDLVYSVENLDIARAQNRLVKRLRVRRLIFRVCTLKFGTRRETQAHIRREHRRVNFPDSDVTIVVEQTN